MILAIAVLSFIRGLQSFNTELLLGTPAGIYVYSTKIYDYVHRDPAAYGEATALGSVFLLVLGVIFLLQNVRGFYLNNWWALFILIPAVGSFADAWNRYRQDGRLSKRVRGALVSGCVFLLITATFLYNWNWGLVLPVLLIIWGLTLLVNSLLPD